MNKWICVLALTVSGSVWACPNCKNAKPDSDDPGLTERMQDGYFWSYISLSSTPFLALGMVSLAMYRSVQKKKREVAV